MQPSLRCLMTEQFYVFTRDIKPMYIQCSLWPHIHLPGHLGEFSATKNYVSIDSFAKQPGVRQDHFTCHWHRLKLRMNENPDWSCQYPKPRDSVSRVCLLRALSSPEVAWRYTAWTSLSAGTASMPGPCSPPVGNTLFNQPLRYYSSTNFTIIYSSFSNEGKK